MISKPSHILFPFYENRRLGFFNEKLQIELPAIYGGGTKRGLDTPFDERHSVFTNGLALVKSQDVKRYLFITPQGKELPDTGWGKDYETPRAFTEGFAAVCIDQKWGFINTQGQMVIAPQYDDVEPFSCGLAAVCADDDVIGFINTQGQMVIGNQYKFRGATFSEGLLLFQEGDKLGYIDTSGQLVIPPIFKSAGSFRDGLALFSENDAKGEEKYGFIDRTGKVVIKPQFIDVLPFSEGLAQVKVKAEAPYHGKWGYINTRGDMVIPPRFGYNAPFSEGLAAVFEEPSGTAYMPHDFGYIDTTGQYVIPPGGSPRITGWGHFTHGLAKVTLHDTKRERDWETNYMDKTGKVVWSSHF